MTKGHSMRQALVVRGGWEGHAPTEATALFIPHLEANGYAVRIEDTPEVYAEGEGLDVDLIVQCYTMGKASDEAIRGLRAAVAAGTGLAGWHGGIADSFRESSDYLHLVGGQFATHPSKPPGELKGDQTDNYLTYAIDIVPAAADHARTSRSNSTWNEGRRSPRPKVGRLRPSTHNSRVTTRQVQWSYYVGVDSAPIEWSAT